MPVLLCCHRVGLMKDNPSLSSPGLTSDLLPASDASPHAVSPGHGPNRLPEPLPTKGVVAAGQGSVRAAAGLLVPHSAAGSRSRWFWKRAVLLQRCSSAAEMTQHANVEAAGTHPQLDSDLMEMNEREKTGWSAGFVPDLCRGSATASWHQNSVSESPGGALWSLSESTRTLSCCLDFLAVIQTITHGSHVCVVTLCVCLRVGGTTSAWADAR